MLRSDPATQLCLTCHADLGFKDKKYVHGPVAAGACILCHDPHSSWYANLLTGAPRNACNACHAGVRESVQKSRHAHPPVAEGRCTLCHDPHASDQRGQLRGDGMTLCVDCHEPIGRAIQSAAHVHGAVKQADGCVACHAGHSSELPRLARQAEPASCLSCHDRPLADASGRRLTNMAEFLKENPNHHGPIRQGQCSACHEPHASPRFRLLIADYPAEFYAPFDLDRYKLCFTCHQKELATAQKGIGVTGFRDGEVNLHYVHVNQQKGRTCRACHEVHASKNPFHMRDAVLFGASEWELKISFTKTDAGGSCGPGCHAERSYDRNRAPASASMPSGVAP